MRLKLTLQYTGTGLHGWQHQDENGLVLPTVEGTLIDAWQQLTAEPAPDFQAAGRTDAGVHALGMVVHVDTEWKHAATPIKVLDGLNHYLPPTIRVVRVAVVENTFHARFSGTARHYRYVLFSGRVMRPDWHGRAGHTRRPVDFNAMRQALESIPLGEQDFSAFRDADCQSNTPMCSLLKREITDAGEGFLHIHISANHFLHHMVRNIVGTLVLIGRGDRPLENMREVLESRDRRQAGSTFSAAGLYFLGVDYQPHAEGEVAGEIPLF